MQSSKLTEKDEFGDLWPVSQSKQKAARQTNWRELGLLAVILCLIVPRILPARETISQRWSGWPKAPNKLVHPGKPRIALCMSGATHTLRHGETYKSYKRAIIDSFKKQRIHADLFLAAYIQYKYRDVDQYLSEDVDVYNQSLTVLQPRTMSWLQMPTEDSDDGERCDVADPVWTCSQHPEFDQCGYRGQAWANCESMISQAEEEDGQPYTHVLVTRPDTTIVGEIEPFETFPQQAVALLPMYECSREGISTWAQASQDPFWTHRALCSEFDNVTPDQIRLFRQESLSDVLDTSNRLRINFDAALLPRAVARSVLTVATQNISRSDLDENCQSPLQDGSTCECKIKTILRQSQNEYPIHAWPQVIKRRKANNPCWNTALTFQGECS